RIEKSKRGEVKHWDGAQEKIGKGAMEILQRDYGAMLIFGKRHNEKIGKGHNKRLEKTM
ncbi:4515_t:CDS:1, partial [Cetraspora pellucida]